jgi:hypothetical protein
MKAVVRARGTLTHRPELRTRSRPGLFRPRNHEGAGAVAPEQIAKALIPAPGPAASGTARGGGMAEGRRSGFPAKR